jgi:hypothetical protein
MSFPLKKLLVKVIPVGGWIIAIAGFFIPTDSIIVKAVWLMVLFASTVLHAVQLPISIPLGRKAGHGYPETIFKTLLFGAAWWMPIKLEMAGEGKTS